MRMVWEVVSGYICKIKIHAGEGQNLEDTVLSFLFLSFRRVLNVIYSFLSNSPASEF